MSELDQTKMNAFVGKMVGVLNGGMLALMTSIGRQTGLFEVMATLPASTSEEIAEAATLNERYVREWLGAMVTGGIVEYDHEANSYLLPAEHAVVLTNAAGSRNMARFTQYIPMLGEVEAYIINCFHNGGGVTYARYPRFQDLMSQSSGLRFDSLLFEKMIPLTGMTEALADEIEVLDVGCGRGHAINMLAQTFLNSEFAGYDFPEEGIAAAKAEAQEMDNRNVRFEVHDLATLNESGRYDLITAFDVIHDQARPAKVLQAIANALTSNGTFLMMDIRASSNLQDNIAYPFAPFLYTISTMHCMTVSLAQDGPGLGTVWGEQKALSMLADAGFADVVVNLIPEDPLNNYYVARKA